MSWRSVLDAFQQLPSDEQRLLLEELSKRDLHVNVALEAWSLGKRNDGNHW